jgi:ketosteroid isomerase-like protein
MDAEGGLTVVRRLLDSFNALESEAAVALCTSDFEWRPAMLGGGLIEGAIYRGAEGIKRFFEVQKETWETISVHPVKSRMFAEVALVEVRLEGVGRASGVRVERTTWNVFRVEGDRVASGRVFLTEEEALEATRAG